jgi:predicted phosphodiesterase
MITHVGGYPERYDLKAKRLILEHRPDVFVCGHSHILKVVRDPSLGGMMVINPGAAGIQGFHLVRTALRFRIDQGRIHSMEVFELDR